MSLLQPWRPDGAPGGEPLCLWLVPPWGFSWVAAGCAPWAPGSLGHLTEVMASQVSGTVVLRVWQEKPHCTQVQLGSCSLCRGNYSMDKTQDRLRVFDWVREEAEWGLWREKHRVKWGWAAAGAGSGSKTRTWWPCMGWKDSLWVQRAMLDAEALPWPCWLPSSQEHLSSWEFWHSSPWTALAFRGEDKYWQQPHACPPQDGGQLAKINTDTSSEGFFLNTFINQC